MSELEQFSKLIGDIYDAALDPALWPEVLHATCDYVVGCAAMLNSQDFVTRSGQKIFSWGDNPEFTRSYFEKYTLTPRESEGSPLPNSAIRILPNG